ncbi:MAG: hypothetical protein JWM93_3518 [Frankiales bacterium]|nr:hypothetical protein [Frankiales bacterium]
MRALSRGLSFATAALLATGGIAAAAAPANATPDPCIASPMMPGCPGATFFMFSVGGVTDGATYADGSVPTATCFFMGIMPAGPALVTRGADVLGGHLEIANCFGSLATYTVLDPPPSAAISVPANVTVVASSVKGGSVFFPLSGNGFLSCDHASGSRFPIGVTAVFCSASLGDTSATGTFTVTVTDPAQVSIDAPKKVTVVTRSATARARAYFDVSANDSLDGQLAVSCNHTSGSSFKRGTTLVTCTATNSRGKTAVAKFNVVVKVATR